MLGLQRDVARDRAAQLRRSQRLEALQLARHARRDDLEGLAGLVDVLARALDGALGGDGAALGAGPAGQLRRGLLALGQVRLGEGDGVLVLLALAQGRLDGREVADLVVDGVAEGRVLARDVLRR